MEKRLFWGKEQTLSRGSKGPTRGPQTHPDGEVGLQPQLKMGFKASKSKLKTRSPEVPDLPTPGAPETRPGLGGCATTSEPHPPQVPQPAGPPAMKTHTALGSQFTTLIEYSN